MRDRYWFLVTGSLAIALVVSVVLGLSDGPAPLVQDGGATPTATPVPERTAMGAPPSPSVAVEPASTPTEAGPAERGTPSPTPPVVISQDTGELIALLEDPRWDVRWDAVNALGEIGDPVAIPALSVRAMTDENPHPRWRSLWAIGAIQPDAVDALPLFLAGLEDPDPVTVHNSAVALAFFNHPDAAPVLLSELNDDDEFIRWEAVFSLRSIGSPEIGEALLPLLDPKVELAADVRGEAALAIGGMGEGEVARSALLAALGGDPSPEVRWRSAMGLGTLGDAAAVPGLERALSTETHEEVRRTIEETLASLAGGSSQE